MIECGGYAEGERKSSPFQNVETGFGAHLSSNSIHTHTGSSPLPGGGGSGRGVNLTLSPSSAEVNREWSYTYLLTYLLT
jgi:hypothetical protein